MKGIGMVQPPPVPGWDGDAAWLSQGGFLFDPVRGLTYSMNDVGSLVYQLLGEGLGVSEIIEALVRRFDVDAATARLDIEDFIAQMRAAGLR